MHLKGKNFDVFFLQIDEDGVFLAGGWRPRRTSTPKKKGGVWGRLGPVPPIATPPASPQWEEVSSFFPRALNFSFFGSKLLSNDVCFIFTAVPAELEQRTRSE